jgi:hypothetical protein
MSARWRQLDGFIVGKKGGVPQGFIDVARLKIRVILEDLLARFAGSQETKEACYREPEPPDAGLAGADGRVDSDTGEFHSRIIPERRQLARMDS